MKLRALLPTVLLLVVGVVACGDDSPTGPISPEDAEFNPGLNIDLATFTELPSGVYIKTEVEGTGAEAAPGDVVTVSYELRLISNTIADASPPNLSFTLGSGRVIAGFDIGVTGMQVGEERRFIVPAELGYGAQRVGPIAPNSVLVFAVTLVSIEGPGTS